MMDVDVLFCRDPQSPVDDAPGTFVLADLDHHNRCGGDLRSGGGRAGSSPDKPERNKTTDQSDSDVA